MEARKEKREGLTMSAPCVKGKGRGAQCAWRHQGQAEEGHQGRPLRG